MSAMRNHDARDIETIFQTAIVTAANILLWPVYIPVHSHIDLFGTDMAMFFGMFWYIPMFINSLIWGIAISWAIGVMKKQTS
jgi:hypothetical protein